MNLKAILISLIILISLSGVAYGAVNPPAGADCDSNDEAGTEEYITAYTTKFPLVWNSINETNPAWSEYSEGVGLICDATQIPGAGIITYDVRVDGLYPSFWSFDVDCGGCYNDITGDETGTSLTWDKASYNKGETATITISFNATNFNRTAYYYELSVIDPVTFENVVFKDITASTYTTSFVMANEGTYSAYAYIAYASNHNTGIQSLQSNRLSSGASISSFVTWNLHNFVVGQSGSMSWGISPSIYDGVYTYSVKIYNGNTLVKQYSNLNNFGVVSYTFSSSGNYRTDLVQSALWDSIISTDPMSVMVSQPQDTISVSKTSYTSDETIYVYGAKYLATNEKSYYSVVISNGQSLTGTISNNKVSGTYPYTFALDYNLPVGSYYASLYGISSLNDCAVVENPSVCYILKDYKTFSVTSPVNGTTGHPDLNITWGATQYKLWETAHFSYQNATYNDTVQIIDNLGATKYQFKVNDQGINTLYSGTVQIDSDPKYIGTWTAKIINGSNSADYKTASVQIISASQANYTNAYGINMNWDIPIGTSGQHKLTWNTGTYSGTYNIKIVDGISGNFILTLPFSTSSTPAQEYIFTFANKPMSYTAQFLDINSTIQASATIEIITTAITTTTPGTGGTWTNPIASNDQTSGEELLSRLWNNFGFVVAMFFVTICAIVGLIIAGGNGGLTLGSMAYIVCVGLGLLSPWTLLLLLAIIVMKWGVFK